MKIGVVSAFNAATPPEFIAAAGSVVEERGFHSLWVPEHALFLREYASHYPNFGGGKASGASDGLIDPFIALTYLAAHTERIRLGTGVCLVPQRHPVYTANQVADLDFLSRGRVDFGVGVGWLRKEFEALGMPWEHRGARTREALGVMKTLWCDEVSHYKGEFYTLPDCLQKPKPIQKPHPPIYFGGESDAALRRVADLGQGWLAFNLAPEALAERLTRLDALLAVAERSRDDVAVAVNLLRPDRDGAARYRDLGVDQLVVLLFARDIDSLKLAADRVMRLGDEA